jgi:hypothetical protein
LRLCTHSLKNARSAAEPALKAPYLAKCFPVSAAPWAATLSIFRCDLLGFGESDVLVSAVVSLSRIKERTRLYASLEDRPRHGSNTQVVTVSIVVVRTTGHGGFRYKIVRLFTRYDPILIFEQLDDCILCLEGIRIGKMVF